MPGTSPPDQLPALRIPMTPLVVGKREVASVAGLLLRDDVPLLTLTGRGGVGNHRLTLAVAHDVAPRFADGVAWVDRAPLVDPALVLPAMAPALGVAEAGDRPPTSRPPRRR